MTITVRKSSSFTDQHDAWVRARVASGHYGSVSEVIRELIRDGVLREAQSAEDSEALRAEIEKGRQNPSAQLK